ncbi:MAG: YdeI/OmpD-associated family protein [Saprospiraceae bacterium]|nr:YdeI/OmpD-associated family protein [Saprospiraceae bacterium]
MAKIDEIPVFYAKTRAEWRAWLQENHETSTGVWLLTYLKETGIPSVNYDDAVEEALCFGWIDSAIRKADNNSTKRLHTPRKLKSNWSALNKSRVDKLIAEGLMMPAGLAKIEWAKQNGTWDALNEVSETIIPPDLMQAFEQNPPALENWEKFSKSSRRGILEWILNAKTAETRQKRIQQTATLAAKNEKANQYVKKN